MELYPWHSLEGLHKQQGLCVPTGADDGGGERPLRGAVSPRDEENKLRNVPMACLLSPA